MQQPGHAAGVSRVWDDFEEKPLNYQNQDWTWNPGGTGPFPFLLSEIKALKPLPSKQLCFYICLLTPNLPSWSLPGAEGTLSSPLPEFQALEPLWNPLAE